MPEADIDDGVITAEDMAEMRDAFEEKRQYDYFERAYPGYTMVKGEHCKNAVNYGDYYYVFMVRTDLLTKMRRE